MLLAAAPFAGLVHHLSAVPDPVFSGRILGDGCALEPCSSPIVEVASPIAGRVAACHPHAFVIEALDPDAAQMPILIHLGIDTVKLRGEGFTSHVTQGDFVAVGDALSTWDTRPAKAADLPLLSPLVALTPAVRVTMLAPFGNEVNAGEPLAQFASQTVPDASLSLRR